VDNPGARRYLRDDATVVSDYPIRAVDHVDRGYTMNGSCARLPSHGNGRDEGIRPRAGQSRTINDE
jgi:hypothetical protein